MLNGRHQMSTSTLHSLNNNTFESHGSNESSSYFVSNYPLKEPVFYIPRVPQLVKVPEPVAATRPPPPGYDMKTLRKQLEYLNNEILTRTETQTLLYTQNEQLWLFIQELQDANKTNAHLMRTEVKRYQDELLDAQNERRRIAEQLVTARNSKKMLEDLNRELESAQLTEQDMDRLKHEAEKELARSKAENALLEHTLQERVSQMTSVHHQLDELRHEAREERDLERAADFYLTNKAILQSAYSRFKTGIAQRLKETRIHHTLHRIYAQYLKLSAVQLWRAYLLRRRVMHRNDERRRAETRYHVFSKWKVYTALERLFRQTRRTHLLRHFYSEWQRSTALARQEHQLEAITDQFQERQYVKRHFLAWKRTIVFLNWNGKQTLALEGIAALYFKRKIITQWKLATDIANNALYQKTCVIPNLIVKNRLHLWHDQCVTVWKARGRLMRRFFAHLRMCIVDRREAAKRLHFGLCVHVRYQKLSSLRRWIGRVRGKQRHNKLLHQYTAVSTSGHVLNNTTSSLNSSRRFTNYELLNHDDHVQRLRSLSGSTVASVNTTPRGGVGVPFTPLMGMQSVGKLSIYTGLGGTNGPSSVSSYARLRAIQTPRTPSHFNTIQVYRLHKYKLIRGALYAVLYSTTVLRRQRTNSQIAMSRYLSSMASSAVRLWRKHVRADVRRRTRTHQSLYRKYFDDWGAFIRQQRADVVYRDKVFAFTDRVQRDRHCHLLRRWRALVRYNKKLEVCHSYLSKRVHFRRLRQVFVFMRNSYSNSLYWRHKQVEVDHAHMASLQSLARLEIADLQSERKRTLRTNEELETRVREMEELLAQRDFDLTTKRQTIAEKESQRAELVDVLQQTQSALSDTQAERERLRGYEQVLQANLDKQHIERSQRQMEVNVMLSNIQTESQALRLEVQAAREQAVYAEQMVVLAAQRESVECARQTALADELETEVVRRREEVQILEREHVGMTRDLARVQAKLLEMARSGEELRGEYAAEIRGKQSEVNVLKSNIGLTEARIAALQAILADNQTDRGQAHVREVRLSEQQELEELEAIRRQLEEEQRGHSQHYYRGTGGEHHSLSSTASSSQQPLRLSMLNGSSPDRAGEDSSHYLTQADLSSFSFSDHQQQHQHVVSAPHNHHPSSSSEQGLRHSRSAPIVGTTALLSSAALHHRSLGLSGSQLGQRPSHSANGYRPPLVASGEDSDLEGVSREDIFRLTSPSKRSPTNHRQALSVSSSGGGSQKAVPTKKVSPFGRASKKTAPAPRGAMSDTTSSDPPSSPAHSECSTSIFDLATIGSMANPYLSAASSAREAIEAAQLRLSARGYGQFRAEEEEGSAYKGGDYASSSVQVEMDGDSVDDFSRGERDRDGSLLGDNRSVASSVPDAVTAGQASYLDAKRTAAELVEVSGREAQYQETRSAIRQLTERLRGGDDAIMQL